MKTILLFIAAAITFVAAAITSLVVFRRAPESATPRLISTTGSAELRVVPDLADLSFQVEVRNPNLAVARQQQWPLQFGARAGKLALRQPRENGIVQCGLIVFVAGTAAGQRLWHHVQQAPIPDCPRMIPEFSQRARH